MDDPISPLNPLVSYLLETFWYPIVFLYGAVVGSFLNVLIYRLPLILVERDAILSSEDEEERKRLPSMNINGKSFCPRCKNYLKPYHNVPLFGFLFLGGRCGFCKTRISWRYFTVELLTACLYVAIFHAVSPHSPVGWLDFIFQALFVSVLVTLIFIDLDHFIAPDELNLAAVVIGIGRDLGCLAIAYFFARSNNADYFFRENAPKYLAAPWVPNAVVGALTYAAVLFLVSIGSHLYYTRPPWEPIGASLKRYFTGDPIPEPPAGYEEAVVEEPVQEPQVEGEEPEEEPARLRPTPGALSLLAALLLAPVIQWYAAIFFVIPMIAFFALSRAPGESVGATLRRFFSADDQMGLPDDALPLPEGESEPLEDANIEDQLQAEADQFALEAETGQHGGMGMGDVKLAFGIGAILGAGLSLLSLVFAAFLGAVIGIALAQRRGKNNLRVAVPFVPFMAAGAIIAMLFGSTLVTWYLNLSGLGKDPVPTPTPIARPNRARPPM